MSSGGTKTVMTPQQSTSNPWDPQQQYLVGGFEQARENLNSAPNRVPQMSAATRDGASMLSDYGVSDGYIAGQGASNAIAQQGGMDAGATGTMRGLLAQGATLDPQGMDYLRAATRGDFLTQQNPFFQQMVDQSISAARPSMDAAFAGSGRMGSGASAAAFADAATRTATGLGYQDYSRERGFQDQAARGLLGASQADAGSRLQAAGMLNGASMDNARLRLGAGQQAAQMQLMPAQAKVQAGSIFDSNAQRVSSAQDEALARYVAAISGNYGGTTSGYTTQAYQKPNEWMQAAGLGISAAGLFCDRRFKTDIERIGTHPAGFGIYAFRYINDPKTYPKVVGPMADEVAEVWPNMVGTLPDGSLFVDARVMESLAVQ